MHRFIYLFFFVFVLAGIVIGDELNQYTIYKVKDIPAGKEKGMIGWEPAVAGGFSGPTSFAISADNIYVPDRVNYRINVYDLNFNFIKTIIEEGKNLIPFSSNMKADKNGNIISYIQGFGLKKIDINGKETFSIPKNVLSNEVNQYRNFFPINDEVFIYNNQGEVEYINNSGKVENVNNAITKLQEITREKEQLENELPGEIKIPDEKKQIIATLQNSKKYLLVGYNFYSIDFRKNKEYFEQIKDIREFVKSEKLKIRGGEENKELNINLDDYDYTLFGYDEEHNGYWGAGKQEGKDIRNLAIIILSKYGEILDGFYFGQYYKNKPNLELYSTSGAEIAIAPSGDIYFLVGSKEKYTLYKVERRW
jgi:hypothetical protein